MFNRLCLLWSGSLSLWAAILLAALCTALGNRVEAVGLKNETASQTGAFRRLYNVLEQSNTRTKFPEGKLFFDAPSKNRYMMDESVPIVLVNATGLNALPPRGYSHPEYGKVQVCVQLVGSLLQWRTKHLIGVFDLDAVLNQKANLTRSSARVIRWSPPTSWTSLTPDSYFYLQADISYKNLNASCARENPKFISHIFNLQFREWEDEGYDWTPK